MLRFYKRCISNCETLSFRGLNLSKIHQPEVIVVYAIGTIYGIFKAILNIKVIYHIRKELDPGEEDMLKIDEV